jgi:hypothetical protein
MHFQGWVQRQFDQRESVRGGIEALVRRAAKEPQRCGPEQAFQGTHQQSTTDESYCTPRDAEVIHYVKGQGIATVRAPKRWKLQA